MAATALMLLALDFAFFPALVEDWILLTALPAARLVNGDLLVMGKYHLHTLRCSSGRITDRSYLEKLGSDVNGIVITVFSAAGVDPVGIGSFGEAVLNTLSETEARRLRTLIQDSPTFTPGKVQVVTLEKPHNSGPLSNIDVVLILRSKRGGGREAKEALKVGLAEVLLQAGKHHVSGLFLPTLTVAPEEQDSPSFDDFFLFLFEGLRQSNLPPSSTSRYLTIGPPRA